MDAITVHQVYSLYTLCKYLLLQHVHQSLHCFPGSYLSRQMRMMMQIGHFVMMFQGQSEDPGFLVPHVESMEAENRRPSSMLLVLLYIGYADKGQAARKDVIVFEDVEIRVTRVYPQPRKYGVEIKDIIIMNP